MARSRSFLIVSVVTALWWVLGLPTSAQTSARLPDPIGVQAPKPAPQTATVYVTKTGEKYHLGTCGSLRKSRIETTVAEAKRRGFTACKICKPPA